jgi:hypothetical protein
MLELIEQSGLAIDNLIDVVGRASLEAVLQLSAQQADGPPQQGKARQGDIVWHGTQPGRVRLKERQFKVNKSYGDSRKCEREFAARSSRRRSHWSRDPSIAEFKWILWGPTQSTNHLQ